MSVLEAIVAVAVAFLGGFVATVVSARQERWKFTQERQAVKEDREEEKADKLAELYTLVESLRDSVTVRQEQLEKRINAVEGQNDSQTEALRLILLDRILHLGQAYIDRTWITLDEKRMLHAMHKCYHDGLGGNGDADIAMEAVDELPVKPDKNG